VSAQALAAQEPLISGDAKKKELVGSYKNAGREQLAPTGKPILVNTHDFIDDELGKAIHYGLYDVGSDEGGVPVGSPTTPSSLPSRRIKSWWKTGLRQADETGLRLRVMHHRLEQACGTGSSTACLAPISINWRARPLLSRRPWSTRSPRPQPAPGLKVYARLATTPTPPRSESATTKCKLSNSPARSPSRLTWACRTL
jgi:hypothetical protein